MFLAESIISAENHVSFEGDEALYASAAAWVVFENHVSFEGDEACRPVLSVPRLFENHVSFEGDEARCARVHHM